MGKIEAFLQKNKVMIVDGALATELEAKGHNLNDELWSAKVLAEKPEAIEQIHYEYLLAGADCIMTASYQATIPGYLKKGYSEKEAEDFITRSVTLAKNARDRFYKDTGEKSGRPYPMIAATVGPYGAYLADGSEYTGDYAVHEDEMIHFHQRRIELLVNAGADLIALETLPNLQEAQVMLKIMRRFPETECWVSFTCKDGQVINDGTDIAVATACVAVHDQVTAVGVNCTPPMYMQEIIKKMKTATDKPVIVYPNSGEVYDPVKKIWNGTGEDGVFAAASRSWYDSGAALIGGCCRTTPADIAEVYRWVDPLRRLG